MTLLFITILLTTYFVIVVQSVDIGFGDRYVTRNILLETSATGTLAFTQRFPPVSDLWLFSKNIIS